MKLPMSLNLTLHQEAVFTCELKNAGGIIWTINDTAHTQHLPPNASVRNHAYGNNTSVLRFSSCINNTAIECRAFYGFGLSEISPSVSMKCQGVLPLFLSLSLSLTHTHTHTCTRTLPSPHSGIIFMPSPSQGYLVPFMILCPLELIPSLGKHLSPLI